MPGIYHLFMTVRRLQLPRTINESMKCMGSETINSGKQRRLSTCQILGTGYHSGREHIYHFRNSLRAIAMRIILLQNGRLILMNDWTSSITTGLGVTAFLNVFNMQSNIMDGMFQGVSGISFPVN